MRLLAYVFVFVILLHLSASTCHATSRNQHLLFAGRAADDDATVLSPAAMIQHHHQQHIAKAEVLSDYNDDARHYHPAMLARWVRGAPPPSFSAVEPSGVEGAPSQPPPPPRKHEDTSAALEPSPSPMPSPPHGEGASSSSSSSDASATEKEASGDVDVDADYDGPMTHPPSHN